MNKYQKMYLQIPRKYAYNGDKNRDYRFRNGGRSFIISTRPSKSFILTVDFYLNAIMQIIMTSDINMQN